MTIINCFNCAEVNKSHRNYRHACCINHNLLSIYSKYFSKGEALIMYGAYLQSW